MNPKHHLDNLKGSVPLSNNNSCPTLNKTLYVLILSENSFLRNYLEPRIL